MAGMKLACGATLIVTQFTDTVEVGSGRGAEASGVAANAREIVPPAAALIAPARAPRCPEPLSSG